jgi:hypothetical protein
VGRQRRSTRALRGPAWPRPRSRAGRQRRSTRALRGPPSQPMASSSVRRRSTVEYDTEHGLDVLCLQIFSLTVVPPDLQKVGNTPSSSPDSVPPDPIVSPRYERRRRLHCSPLLGPDAVCVLAGRGGGRWVGGGRRHRSGNRL